MSAYDRFYTFIVDREAIRQRRLRGCNPPWTPDPILQQWRFCNVDREEDTVTRWIAANVRTRTNEPLLWFNLVIARFFNLPETLERLGFIVDWNPTAFNLTMDHLQHTQARLYNSAYMIRAGTGADSGMPKHRYLVKRVFHPMWEARRLAPVAASCQEWSNWFRGFFGMGDFMRNQVITDMKHTQYLEHAEDWETFVLLGPGTRRGMERLHLATTPERLLGLRGDLVKGLPGLARVWAEPNNVANALCEFDKYERVRLREGRPKQRYPGQGE